MTPQTTPPPPPFSVPEQEALVTLRHRFAPHHDRFSPRELAQLRVPALAVPALRVSSRDTRRLWRCNV